jgi:hypothetical protein
VVELAGGVDEIYGEITSSQVEDVRKLEAKSTKRTVSCNLTEAFLDFIQSQRKCQGVIKDWSTRGVSLAPGPSPRGKKRGLQVKWLVPKSPRTSSLRDRPTMFSNPPDIHPPKLWPSK